MSVKACTSDVLAASSCGTLGTVIDEGDLPAGEFSAWLAGMQRALRAEVESDVPCDGCTACCRSSQFVHIEPDETDALAHIPSELLFPAPRLPLGHVVMGYDDAGCCPMLIDDRCSIYEHRPRTCRTYDCRVLPAAGLTPEDADGPIARRARRWRFDHPAERDRREHEAVRAAAAFLQEHGDDVLPDGAPPAPIHLAVLAVVAHDAFLGEDGDTGRPSVVTPTPAEVRVALARRVRPAPDD
jgi:Fe-S-cluster containining protein